MNRQLERTVKIDDRYDGALLDRAPEQLVGAALARYEGALKVSGQATYTAEFAFADLAHGMLVPATVATGTVVDLITDEALAVPGVIDVFADDRFIRHSEQPGSDGTPNRANIEVVYAGQPIALVVAETLEAAREGALLVRPVYHQEPGLLEFEQRLDQAIEPADGGATPAFFDQGDLETAMREAEVTVDVVYTTPSQSHVSMEPHAAIAFWDGDRLTAYSSLQMLSTDREQLAKALGIDQEQIRLRSLYVGGGFGSKLFISPELVASAIASQRIGRPVKTVMTRQQAMLGTVRRSNTHQRVRLGATRDGRLQAIGHESSVSNLPGHHFFEPCGVSTHFLYAGENRLITHPLVPMNWLAAGSMRAPGEGAGMLALECAMDELAGSLGIDPVELRVLNEPKVDPEKGIPFSSRRLVDCLRTGAERFGWSSRNPHPGQVREGDQWIGLGMAAASRSNVLAKSSARVTLTPELRVAVETDMTDIGTGTYSILAQISADLLGVPVTSVDVRLGDTDFPEGAGSGGSKAAASGGSATYLACDMIRAELAQRIGCDPSRLELANGVATVDSQRYPVEEYIGDGIEALGSIEPGENEERFTQASFGAHLAEVAVDAWTGEVRVRRMLGVFAAGRLLNEQTARSQCLGGMIFGIGAALTEEAVHDPRTGKIVNHDLASYHVPVHADVPDVDVIFLEERDPWANPLQAKGIGELGISGAGAAIVNAVYNATGVRMRDYPLTPDKILSHLPGR
jgi:xanthine dehydrogenase YagR molybdenum-binding subunit